MKSQTFLSAQWRWLALVNYSIPPEVLQPYVPKGVELDICDGQTYVSLVAFLFTDTRLKGLKIPCHANFEELNLRFYVVRRVGNEVRRGVVFIKELVPKMAVAVIARRFYNENYYVAPMKHLVAFEQDAGPRVHYEFKVNRRWNSLSISTRSEAHVPTGDSHEAFILEHYWGYTAQRDGGTIEYHVAHPRWNVWASEQCDVDCDFESVYGSEFAKILAQTPYSAFVADGSAVTVAKPQCVCNAVRQVMSSC